MSGAEDLAPWARREAFPLKPSGRAYGVVDSKDVAHGFEEFSELEGYLGSGKGELAWVWTPEEARLVAPEEVPRLVKVLEKRRMLAVARRWDAARDGLKFSGVLGLMGLFCGWKGLVILGLGGWGWLGLSALWALIFSARPAWDAWKRGKKENRWTEEVMVAEIPDARFELWMDRQRVPFTLVLMVLLGLVGLVQWLTPGNSIAVAGLDKARYFELGERWRMFTGAFLHGNLLHFVLNASALWYLGRRVEILARWPHLGGSFLFGLVGAGWATTSWTAATSVGISGVVCGLLGFLLVFETLHAGLVPRPARRRVAGALISLVVIGALGFRFIDNAAHFGGLVAGAVYAAVVFPPSACPQRPTILLRDRIVGGGYFLVIVLAGLGTVVILLRG